jgi:hypothetical protein
VINVYTDLAIVSGPSGDTVLVSWTKNRDVAAIEILGCTDPLSCTFNPEANVNDNSCAYPGSSCDDGNPLTDNDIYSEECFCSGILGIVKNEKSGLIIFPNPANNMLIIDWEGHTNFEVEILDLPGRKMVSVSATLPNQILAISHLTNGIYFIRLNDGNYERFERITVNH